MRRTGYAIVSAILISVLVLTGCKSTTTTTTTASGPQILRVNLAGEPAQIDPNRASWASERTIILQVFDGLLGFNQDLSLRADVASQIPTTSNGGISADGKTYTFKLRNNVTWSDKTKVTAKDFVYSIKRMLDPALAGDYASFYYVIAGAEAYNGSTSKDAAALQKLKDAVGVKAVDDYQLQITLAQPLPTFLQLMALWPTYPVRQDVIEKYGDKWTEAGNYIGNGAFTLKEWVHQDHITLVANPNYWGEKPKLTQIDIKMITDANAALAAYKNNELDITAVPPGTEKATIGDPALSPRIVRFPELTTFGFRYNLAVAPFDNLKVRQALNNAVDRSAFVDKVRNGVGKVATSWIPPGMPGYNATLGSQYGFDVTKAKQLLSEAGYSDISKLPAIKFTYADTAGNKTIAQFLQGQLKDNLGINLALDPLESKAYSQAYNNKQYQLCWTGWGADYPDPDNWLPELFGTGAGNNKQNYSNSAFDAASKLAKAELDNTKRLKAWDDAQKIIVDDAAMLFMFYRERFVLVNSSVNGLKTTGMDGQVAGDMFFSNVSIKK